MKFIIGMIIVSYLWMCVEDFIFSLKEGELEGYLLLLNDSLFMGVLILVINILTFPVKTLIKSFHK